MQPKTNFIITIPYSPKKGVHAEQMWCPFLEADWVSSYDIRSDYFYASNIDRKIKKIRETTKYNIYWVAVNVNDPELCYQTRQSHTGVIADARKPEDGQFIHYRGKNLPEIKAKVARQWLQNPERSEDVVYFNSGSGNSSLSPGEQSALKIWFLGALLEASNNPALLTYLQNRATERGITNIREGIAALEAHVRKVRAYADTLENAYNGPNFSGYLSKV